MVRSERFTALVSAALMLGALLACKKKAEELTQELTGGPSASASAAAPAPTPEPVASAPALAAPKLGDVTRYADKEKKGDEAAVKVLESDVKVFNQADTATPEVATLPKDLLVFRIAEVDGFQLVEFPSGIGQFSQGWVETKLLSTEPVKVAREAVLKDEKTADIKADAGAPAPKPTSSAKPSPSAKPSATATAKPSATATAKPSATATAKPSAAPTSKPSAAPTAKPTATATTKPTSTGKPVAPPPPPPPKTDDKKKKTEEKKKK